MPSAENKTLAAVIEILSPFAPENITVTPQSTLMKDLELDSVKVMELMMNLEDHFDISIPLNVLPEVNDIQDLVNEIDKIIGTV
ncbi:MAG: phosphopantetheine-binding protein [Gammaproteobacteria bacterium]|jgi:acyl carrier protein|nr:phosphopantetheine-binding protein [Gammaproteobacteria bacterium]|tara:strand:+ start:113841 stop:114092 length:252 start_codon:yes stop_codon:yes gene_type:complete